MRHLACDSRDAHKNYHVGHRRLCLSSGVWANLRSVSAQKDQVLESRGMRTCK
jgi:hypothetical protein